MEIGLTQEEADRLIEMTKEALRSALSFPAKGQEKEFEVIGLTSPEMFIINIFRGRISQTKCNFGARIKKQGIVILELHINPTNVHINPDGEKILCSHWHVYKEEYGLKWAFPVNDINDEDFVGNTIEFLKKFNVIKCPKIECQGVLF